jgi:hypothetical protein
LQEKLLEKVQEDAKVTFPPVLPEDIVCMVLPFELIVMLVVPCMAKGPVKVRAPPADMVILP